MRPSRLPPKEPQLYPRHPRPVLSAQRFKARGEAVAATKAQGIEYEQRFELLEEVTYPQLLVELLSGAR